MNTIYWTDEVRAFVRACIEAVDTEVGGFGYAKRDEDGDVVWYEAFLVPQYVSKSEVDFESLGGDEYAITKAAQDGKLDDPDHIWVKWHSHGKGSTFWSAIDDKYNASLAATGMPVLLDFVGNHKGDYRCRLEMYNVKHGPVEIPRLTIDDLDVRDYSTLQVDDNLAQLLNEFVKDKPKPKTKGKFGPHSVPRTIRNSDPGDKLEEALSELDAERLLNRHEFGDEPWLPTLVNPEVIPAGATCLNGVELGDEELSELHDHGFHIVEAGGDSYLVDDDSYKKVLVDDASYAAEHADSPPYHDCRVNQQTKRSIERVNASDWMAFTFDEPEDEVYTWVHTFTDEQYDDPRAAALAWLDNKPGAVQLPAAEEHEQLKEAA